MAIERNGLSWKYAFAKTIANGFAQKRQAIISMGEDNLAVNDHYHGYWS